MKFSKVASLAILGFVAAEASPDCTPETITETTTVGTEHTVTVAGNTETHTVTSAVTITAHETREVTAFSTVTQTGQHPDEHQSLVSTSDGAVVTGNTSPNGISGGNGHGKGEHKHNGDSSSSVSSGGDVSTEGSLPTPLPQTSVISEPGGFNAIGNSIPPFTAEHEGRSTSCDYAHGQSTVFEYPAAAATQSGKFKCDQAIYEETVVIKNIILELEVRKEIIEETIIKMITVTRSMPDTAPTHLPVRPPPPPPAKLQLIAPGIGNETFPSTATYHFPGTNTAPATPLSTSDAPGRVHPIDVSFDGRFMYESNHLDATVGELLQFEFQGTNVTVHETTFENPCTPILGGFIAGFNQTNSDTTVHIKHAYPIKDDRPHYFFCGGNRACTTETVFAVNVKTEEWASLEENIAVEKIHRNGPVPQKREPVPMPRYEPQIPGRRSVKWWS